MGSLGIDRRFAAWTVAGALAGLLAFGIVSAIIPNPVFGRSIAPEPFAIAIWLVSAPLVGLLAATYRAPAPVGTTTETPRPLTDPGQDTGGILGAVAGIGAFLAIGCPVCNKVALVLLGASGALSIWAPLQPIIGFASIVLLVAAVAWRLRLRAAGGACPVAVPRD